MLYSIWPNVEALVKQATEKPCFSNLIKQYCLIAEDEWNEVENGGTFFGGGTKNVVKTYYGPHEYEAKIISNIESQIVGENFFKKKFVFRSRQIQGQRVDIPRYLNGDQRYWFSVKKVPMPNRAIRVFAPMGGTAGVSSKEMSICGALTCAVCEALETCGINVELWASCCSKGVLSVNTIASPTNVRLFNSSTRPNDICQLVKIKDSSSYCDYGMINYITGNSGFYRNIIFKDRICAVAKVASSTEVHYNGVGCSYNFSEENIPKDDEYSEADIIIPRIYEIDRAKTWMEENLEEKISKVNETFENNIQE